MGNPVQNGCDNHYVLEGLKKIPFIASIAYHVDEPAQLADILFPEDSVLEATSMYRLFRNEKESTDATRGLYMTLVKHQAVDRLYDTRSANDIFIDLADRIGILEPLTIDINKNILRGDRQGLSEKNALDTATKYSWDEIVMRKLKNDYGDQVSFADFEEHAFKYEMSPTVAETYNYYSAPDNTVRLPIYFPRLPKSWKKLKKIWRNQGWMRSPIRIWKMSPAITRLSQFGTSRRIMAKTTPTRISRSSGKITSPTKTRSSGWQSLVARCDYRFVPDAKKIILPSGLAEEVGVGEGDQIWVESTYGGKTEGKVHISQLIHPECIGISGNYGKSGLQLILWRKKDRISIS